MAQPDLATLYQNLGPATASIIAGQREGANNYTQSLADMHSQNANDAQIQAAQQAAQMNPLLVQQQQGVNKQQGLTADKMGMENAAMQATQPGAIAATNSANKTKVTADALSQMNHIAEMAGQFGTQLDSIPVLARPQIVQKFIQDNQIDPNGQIGKMLSSTPPDKLPMLLQQAQQKLQQSSAAYRQAMELEDKKTKSAKEVAGIHAGATIEAANIAAKSRLDVKNAGSKGAAQAIEASLLKQKIPEQYATLNQAALIAERNGEDSLAETYRARAEAIRPQVQAAMAAAGTAQTTLGADGSVVSGVRGAAVPDISPQQPVAKPAGAAAVQSLADLQKLYPSRSPEELRAAYRRKHGVDLK